MTEMWAVNSAVRFAPLFAQQAAWIRNIKTGVTQPYLVSNSTIEAIKAIVVDGSLVANLDTATIRELDEIGIIFDESSLQSDKGSWSLHLEKAKMEIRQQLWTVVKGLFNPAGAPAFRAWVGHLRPLYRNGDSQVANRINCHNDVLCRSFHAEFSKVLIPLFPEPVKPSYCYLGIYHNQAKLPKHTDREQCRWNVSVVLDSYPEITNLEDCWPIFLETFPNKHTRVDAIIGDAIVYRGDKIPHWRDSLPARFTQVSICFFHYVHEMFSDSLV
jgi:hypothetical protein